jgi:hypothetical protein
VILAILSFECLSVSLRRPRGGAEKGKIKQEKKFVALSDQKGP